MEAINVALPLQRQALGKLSVDMKGGGGSGGGMEKAFTVRRRRSILNPSTSNKATDQQRIQNKQSESEA